MGNNLNKTITISCDEFLKKAADIALKLTAEEQDKGKKFDFITRFGLISAIIASELFDKEEAENE